MTQDEGKSAWPPSWSSCGDTRGSSVWRAEEDGSGGRGAARLQGAAPLRKPSRRGCRGPASVPAAPGLGRLRLWAGTPSQARGVAPAPPRAAAQAAQRWSRLPLCPTGAQGQGCLSVSIQKWAAQSRESCTSPLHRMGSPRTCMCNIAHACTHVCTRGHLHTRILTHIDANQTPSDPASGQWACKLGCKTASGGGNSPSKVEARLLEGSQESEPPA